MRFRKALTRMAGSRGDCRDLGTIFIFAKICKNLAKISPELPTSHREGQGLIEIVKNNNQDHSWRE